MSLPTREYFDKLYEENDDPWNYERSEYEKDKYEVTLRALPRDQYEAGLEIGCSIGVLTAKLAPRCKSLLSVDLSPAALEKAKQRCSRYPHVKFQRLELPAEYPPGLFDLTVLSEVGYYLDLEDLIKLAEAIRNHTAQGGHLIMVHWLARVPGFPLQGDDVHGLFLRQPGWQCKKQARTEFYRIDVLERHSR